MSDEEFKMNYMKVYNSLIEKCKLRNEVFGYTEIHHIVPRSFGGGDELDNLVILTGREHFIAHRLLAKIYPNSGMVHAIFKMACVSKTTKKFKVTSRLYEYLRQEHARRISENDEANAKKGRPGRKQSVEHIKARIESRKNNGYWISEEGRKNISKGLKGKPSVRKGKPLETTAQINGHKRAIETRKKNGGYKRSAEMNEAVRKALLGKPANRPPLSEEKKDVLRQEKSKTITCPYCNKTGQCMVMYRWHFDNCKNKVD